MATMRRTGYADVFRYLGNTLAIVGFVMSLFIGIRLYMLIGVFNDTVVAVFIMASVSGGLLVLLKFMGKGLGLRLASGKCELCGVEFGRDTCPECGRRFGYKCAHPNAQLSGYCEDCMTCPICGINLGNAHCLVCGKFVCENCHDEASATCIECASEGKGKRVRVRMTRTTTTKRSSTELEDAKVVVLEPTTFLSYKAAELLRKFAKDDIVGNSIRNGDEVKTLGTTFKVSATAPSGLVKIVHATALNIVHPQERGRVIEQRKRGSLKCKYCDSVAISVKCRVCREPICDRHRIFCSSCGFYVGPDHFLKEKNRCTRCAGISEKVQQAPAAEAT
jgi:hypothetical protein